MPATATNSRKRVRVMKFHIALPGGNRARAAFQFMPPLGNSMVMCVSPARSTPDGAQAERVCDAPLVGPGLLLLLLLLLRPPILFARSDFPVLGGLFRWWWSRER